MRFKLLAVVAGAVLTAGIGAASAPAEAVSLTHQGPATLPELAREAAPQCQPCGPYSIALINPPNSNFVAITGEGHNNPVSMGPYGSRFYFYNVGSFHGVTMWQVKDTYTGLCLNATWSWSLSEWEISLDSCPSGDVNEEFQLNARSAHYISNVGMSQYYGDGVQSGDLSADEANNTVEVLNNPGNHFWDQWILG